MVTDGPADQNGVTGAGVARADIQTGRNDAHAGCVYINAVAMAFLYHLGITGGDFHSGFFAGPGHGGDDIAEGVHRQTLLQDEAGRKEKRPGTAHGQVIDRAVDGQVANIPAGEEERADHEGIGGEGNVDPTDC